MVIVALLGKSGSGKSTLERKFESLGFSRIISYTTREMREGEQNHRDYHFVSKEQFDNLVKSNIIIESVIYNNNFYGAPKPVGSDKYVVVLEPDGMAKFKQLYGNQVISVYLDTPDDTIDERLDIRNDTPDRESRKSEDNLKFADIKSKVDLVINGENTVSYNVVMIMRAINERYKVN